MHADSLVALSPGLTHGIIAGVIGQEPATVGMPAAAGAPPATGTTTTQPGSGAPAPKGKAPAFDSFLIPVMVIMVVMILMSIFSGRKERRRRQEMLGGLKKQDKVMMSGGIIGTVIELTDAEVVIRSEDTKLRLSRGAVQQILESSKGKASMIAEAKLAEREPANA